MVSAVTAQGMLRFQVFEGSCNTERLIEFRKRLVADIARPGVAGR